MKASLIEIGKAIDKRGELNFIDLQKNVPFEIKNFFFIKNVPQGQKRGCHSNTKSHELVVVVQGELTVKLNKKDQFILNSKNGNALFIPSNNWIELFDFSEDSICVVIGSEPYDENEKIVNE